MRINRRPGRAFTLVEVVVVIAVIVVVGLVIFTNLLGGKSQADLNSATTQIVASTRQAQSEAAAQSGNAVWGIHFANTTNTTPYYAIFTGSSYASGTVQGRYPLPPTVGYVTSTLPAGSSEDVIFSGITGAPTATTSIGLYLISNPADTQYVAVNGVGQVSYSSSAPAVSSQNIWVADEGGQRIEKFNSSGVYQSQISICATGLCNATTTNGGFQYPYAVAVDSSGNIWVADSQNNRVEKFNSSGVYQSEIGLGCGPTAVQNYGDACMPTSTNGGFQYPWGIAIDSNGNIWVADQDNNRVEKFNSSGVYQSQLGICSSGGCAATSTNGMFNYPYGIAIDSNGNIWVADQNNNRVERFNSSGVYQSQLGICTTGGCVTTSTNGGFHGPQGVAIDSSGNIWVTDIDNSRIETFNPSGAYQSQLGFCPSGAWCIATSTAVVSGFFDPAGIAIDASGNIWVVDLKNHILDEFNPAGTYQYFYLGFPTSTTGSFGYPTGIAIH